MKVNGKDDIPYMKWKIKKMFQTTNQYIYITSIPSMPSQCIRLLQVFIPIYEMENHQF